MGNRRIIEYSISWRDDLYRYIRNTFPSFSDNYIEYCLDHSADRRPSRIVLNERDEIVGCHLYFCTKVLLEGKEIETLWGYNTYLDEEYRKEMGLDLMLETLSTKGFGLGLTDINEKLQKKMKRVFFRGVGIHYTITKAFLFSPFQKIFHKTIKLKLPEHFSQGKQLFRRVYDASEISIPNGGYWFKGYRDIDFIRDENFLNQRFLHNKVHHYFMYATEFEEHPCYFVVRQSLYRGIPALILSDYRYSDNSEQAAKIILKAVKRLASQSHIGVLVFVCGDTNIEHIMKRSLYHITPLDFVSNMKISGDLTFCITGADSDADFLQS